MKKIVSFLLVLALVLNTAFSVSAADYFAQGIDVSKWQTDIDFEKVKQDGNDFVIIRVGYSEVKDPLFEEHYENARAAGMDIGIYMYSYAVTVAEAERDAADVLSWIEGKHFEYPIYYDMEDERYQGNLTTRQRTDIALAFVKKIQEAGYYAGVYANRNWFTNYIYLEEIQNVCDTWIAHYKYENGVWVDGEWVLPDYKSQGHGLYQYTQTGTVNGYSGDIDKDISYIDYPSLMAALGLNGYPKLDKTTPHFVLLGDKWYYADNGRVQINTTGVIDYNGAKYYIKKGIMQTGWISEGEDWYYANQNGALKIGAFNQGDHTYYFDWNGKMYKNRWLLDSRGWKYFGSNGKLERNNWVLDSQGWCYLDYNGYCVTNKWMLDSKGWCYLGADGRVVTNKWLLDTQGWCYVGADGYCVTNKWMLDSKGWCYLGADGRVVTNKWILDSQGWCYVDHNGYCITNRWMLDSQGWCYLGADGRMETNRWILDSQGWCYVGANGYCVTNKWMLDSKGWCYLGSDGRMVKNKWVYDGRRRCWIGADGYWVA